MAGSGDLINFDVIEAQKENIQALPSGRSAKKLAEAFSPSPLQSLSTPTPTDTKNVNDCIRAEYEAEVANISEADDPLDVYDRYVRWTFDAYPSAQATPSSQLHTLLERATKAFINSAQYKNDPRYMKLWMHYIQFFSDAPKETFLFLSRHGIGERMALFYEEYAAWLEGAGRFAQAEEVYKLGIEREARPQPRLMRKFKEFEERRAQQGDETDEPSSPALPTVRPALAAKVDPFAAARAELENPQAPRPSNGVGGPAAKPGKAKMAIFSDAGADAAPALSERGADSKGWDTIDSLANRKKENVMEPKPWVGETLKAGGKKSAAPKMQIFKDTSQSKKSQLAKSHITLVPSSVQVMVNPMNGKREQIFVNLEAVYPTPEEPGSELSFEEIWAANRGWLDHSWAEAEPARQQGSEVDRLGVAMSEKLVVHTETVSLDENGNIKKKDGRGKKKKVMEINETQIIKANLDAEPKGKLKSKRKSLAEPTMTLHTKAATDDIYEIFNQPLKQPGGVDGDDDDEEGDENTTSDDDYETDGHDDSDVDSTVTTTRHIDVSQAGEDEEESDVKSVSEWSDFSTRRHIPDLNGEAPDAVGHEESYDNTQVSDMIDLHDGEPSGPVESSIEEEEEEDDKDDNDEPRTKTVFVPVPPEDYEPRIRPFRDAAEVANNRLPFMTPISERTEMSLGAMTLQKERLQHLNTLEDGESEDDGGEAEMVDGTEHFDLDQLPSSPLKEVVNESRPLKISQPVALKGPGKAGKAIPPKGPIIKDPQCNPVDDAVREEILANIHPPLSSYAGFYDHRHQRYERGGEIRRFAKALNKAKGHGSDRTSGGLAVVNIEFPGGEPSYVVRKEIGAGAFAPVYLVENPNAGRPSVADDDKENAGDENAPVAVMGKGAFAVRPRTPLEALKMEQPPCPWEFHMMRVAHARLGPHHRAATSLSYAHEMHLYQDEGFLFLPYHPHGSLLDVVNFFRGVDPAAVMDEQLAMFFTVELLRTVEALHAHGVMHGDLKPDNCLLRLDALGSAGETASHAAPLATQYRADGTGGWDQRGVTLIDFGRAIDSRNFSRETQFVADWKTSAQDCAEMREGRPWTWQIDYHGLAGVIHCLLFGRYIETVRCDQGGIGSGRRYRIRESLKRYWQTEIWGGCFDLLLNPGAHVEREEGARMPVLKGMKEVREGMEAWLERNCERGVGLKGLVGRVEAYARARKA